MRNHNCQLCTNRKTNSATLNKYIQTLENMQKTQFLFVFCFVLLSFKTNIKRFASVSLLSTHHAESCLSDCIKESASNSSRSTSMVSDYVLLRRQNKIRQCCIFVTIVGIVALICLSIGIALIVQDKKRDDCEPRRAESQAKPDQCQYSEEAKRVKLEDFLQKSQAKYYELNPHKIALKPGVKPDEVRTKYRSYDPSPANIKRITDEAQKIAKNLENMKIDMNKLTLREKRAVSQILHWTEHGFPFMVPYLYNYYVGDWMMGGDIFCWSPICIVPDEIKASLGHFKSSTVREMEILRDKLKEIKHTFDRFVENMKLGVSAGMVRTMTECKAALDAFKDKFRNVANNGPKGKDFFK